MDQLNGLADIQPPDRMLPQPRAADGLAVAFAAEAPAHLNGKRKHLDAAPLVYRGTPHAKRGEMAPSLFGESQTGRRLRRLQQELRELSKQMLSIQEKERQRIAADLHDGIGQSLSLVKLSLDLVMQQLKAGRSDEAVASLHEVSHKVKETLMELRRTTMDLRPSMLDDLGLVPTLSWLLREFEAAWRDRTLEREIEISESDVPKPLKGVIFRILQEATCNIVKHADANWVRITLKKTDGALLLTIEDNGRGFDAAAVAMRQGADRGFGLLTMKERARSSDGAFEMKSAPQQGTQIYISWRAAENAGAPSHPRAPGARDN